MLNFPRGLLIFLFFYESSGDYLSILISVELSWFIDFTSDAPLRDMIILHLSLRTFSNLFLVHTL